MTCRPTSGPLSCCGTRPTRSPRSTGRTSTPAPGRHDRELSGERARGFVQAGMSTAEAEALIRLSIAVARDVRDERPTGPPRSCASVGPYGAVLADGSEYTGQYGLTTTQLYDFHRPRLELLASEEPDMFAVETIPDIDEARVLAGLLDEIGIPAWLSFTIDGARHPRRSAAGRCRSRSSRTPMRSSRPASTAAAGSDVLDCRPDRARRHGQAGRRLPQQRPGLGQREPHLARRAVVRPAASCRRGSTPASRMSEGAAASARPTSRHSPRASPDGSPRRDPVSDWKHDQPHLAHHDRLP